MIVSLSHNGFVPHESDEHNYNNESIRLQISDTWLLTQNHNDRQNWKLDFIARPQANNDVLQVKFNDCNDVNGHLRPVRHLFAPHINEFTTYSNTFLMSSWYIFIVYGNFHLRGRFLWIVGIHCFCPMKYCTLCNYKMRLLSSTSHHSIVDRLSVNTWSVTDLLFLILLWDISNLENE